MQILVIIGIGYLIYTVFNGKTEEDKQSASNNLIRCFQYLSKIFFR